MTTYIYIYRQRTVSDCFAAVFSVMREMRGQRMVHTNPGRRGCMLVLACGLVRKNNVTYFVAFSLYIFFNELQGGESIIIAV